MTWLTAQVVQRCSSSDPALRTFRVECESCVWVWGNTATPMLQSLFMWGSNDLFSQSFPTHSFPLSNSSDIRRWSFNEIITFILLTTSPSQQQTHLQGNHSWSYKYHMHDDRYCKIILYWSFISVFFFSKCEVPGKYRNFTSTIPLPLSVVGSPLWGRTPLGRQRKQQGRTKTWKEPSSCNIRTEYDFL